MPSRRFTPLYSPAHQIKACLSLNDGVKRSHVTETVEKSSSPVKNAVSIERQRKPRSGPGSITQCVDVQQNLHHAVETLREDLKSCPTPRERALIVSAMASAAKGWQSVTDQLRELRGKPRAGALRPEPRARHKPKPKVDHLELQDEPEAPLV